MEWLMYSRATLQVPCASLGWKEGDTYVPSPECKVHLEALEKELSKEDLVTRNVRRNLSLSRVIQKDLVPILINVEDRDIVSVAIRILVNLTLPVECLLPVHVASRTATGQEAIRQLQTLTGNAKKAFLDVQVTASIVKIIKDILYNEHDSFSLLECDCEDVNNCLLLLRNILYVPDKSETQLYNKECLMEFQNLQNKLVWNLFAQGLDVALLLMMNNKNKAFWTISMVQLIALLYKDQHVDKIQNLLNQVPDESDSSDDDVESDGSKCSGGNSSGGNSSSCRSSKTSRSDSGCPQSSDTWGDSSSCNSRNTVSSGRTSRRNSLHHMDVQTSDIQLTPRETDKPRSPIMNVRRSPVPCRRRSLTMALDPPMNKLTEDDQTATRVFSTDSDNLDSSGFSNGTSSSEEYEGSRKRKDMSDGKGNEYTSERRHSATYINNLMVMTNSAKNSANKHRASCKKSNRDSDSSNEDEPVVQDSCKMVKIRRKARSIGIGKGLKCSSSVCFDAAEESANSKGKSITKGALLEKRKVPRLLGINLTHDPTDDDISHLLKDFTLSFLHNGFADLVTELKKLILVQNPVVLDKSHFLWLLTYFLQLSSSLSLSFHHVKCILSPDIISYLTFEGVTMSEELELFFRSPQNNIKPLLRRMHLLVSAFREIITTIDCYSKKPISKKEKVLLQQLRRQIADTSDVRQVFLLLIRNYRPMVHSKQYLVDIITTNHMLLLLLEKVASDDERKQNLELDSHLQQFANAKVMEQFGQLLQDFKTNSEFINDCLFTIMHHVAGDLKCPQALFQPIILKSFCRILEEEEAETFKTMPYWDELITYILNKFMKTAQCNPKASVRKLFSLMTVNSDRGTECMGSSADCSSTECGSSTSTSSFKINDKEDALYWWYLQFEHEEDPVGRIVESLAETQTQVSRSKVIQELLVQGVVTQADYEKLKVKEKTNAERRESETNTPNIIKAEPDSIQSLILELAPNGMQHNLEWLQNVLLEACYVKLGGRNSEEKPLEDPVPYYSTKMNQSIPLVPYSDAQESALHSDQFVNLLHKLGIHLPTDVNKVYPRIPCFWTADDMYSMAAKLGPIDENALKFKLKDLKCMSSTDVDETMDISKHFMFNGKVPPCSPLTPFKVTDSWICVVQKSKVIQPMMTAAARVGFS